MAGLEEFTDLNSFEDQLQGRVKELSTSLENGDLSGAMARLAELSEARNQLLYQEVGRLTRGLHEAIKAFNIDVENSTAFQTSASDTEISEVANANERLNYVLELTEGAANTTMDMVDASMPVAEEIGEQARLLREDWKKMSDSKSTLAEIKDLGRSTEAFLQEIENGTNILHKNFTEILLAQGFQDLTGQLITRVIGLVNDVESNLVNLVKVAGKVDSITGRSQEELVEPSSEEKAEEAEEKLVKGHGPQVHAEEVSDVVSGQDDVDDLLSSLGF
ncbi:MAG: protein phosphatase CheZ [Motiliproteus sp.]|nr:protein phosphatase CheZ [Motiliproteus sp.]MCW9051747.1 protein phosphatase CheZ [Motiliproteus sp.]